jgi:hypothetical protein
VEVAEWRPPGFGQGVPLTAAARLRRSAGEHLSGGLSAGWRSTESSGSTPRSARPAPHVGWSGRPDGCEIVASEAERQEAERDEQQRDEMRWPPETRRRTVATPSPIARARIWVLLWLCQAINVLQRTVRRSGPSTCYERPGFLPSNRMGSLNARKWARRLHE